MTLPVVDQAYSHYICGCHYRFELKLGAYGCPNCNGDNGPAQLASKAVKRRGEDGPVLSLVIGGKSDDQASEG